jgi:hypothetical protein
MVDKQSVCSLSPRGTDTLLWEDIELKRRTGNSNHTATSTFDIIARRFTTFTSTTSSYDNKIPCTIAGDTVRQIKLKIIKYNPMVFLMLREYLIARRCHTNVTVSCMLRQFIDVELRIPELRVDIINHHLSFTHRQSCKNISISSSNIFFAYLTGESLSPSTIGTLDKRVTPTSLTRSVTSSSSYSDSSTSQFSQELSLPSLQSFGHFTSDDSDDVEFCEI